MGCDSIAGNADEVLRLNGKEVENIIGNGEDIVRKF